MPDTLLLNVPAEVAESLTADGSAVRTLSTRGPSGDVIHILVNGVNTGASLITVGAAAGALYKVSTRLAGILRRRRHDGQTQVTFRGPLWGGCAGNGGETRRGREPNSEP
jgi:hypothetical protein